MYAFAFGRGNKAVIVFRFEDVDAALAAVRETNVGILGPAELAKLSEH